MSGYFKNFIDTTGKSLKEIRELAEKMAKRAATSVIDTITDEAELALHKSIQNKIQEVIRDTQNLSESITPSGEAPRPEKRKQPEELDYPHESIIYKPREEAPRPEKRRQLMPDEIAYPHESIPDNLTEREMQLTEKIFAMRKLREITYNGYIVQRCAEVTFVMQGDFMVEVTDDYPRNAFCGMAMPMHAAMSNSQLRTFFTWRTDARRGIYRETDKAYVLLYAYELMNKVGVLSSEEAFGKLVDLWHGCSFAKYLDELMPRWLKDFAAFNDISAAYPDINEYLKRAKKSPEEKAAEEILDKSYRQKLDFLAENSAYDIKKSSYFSEKTKPLLEGAAQAVLEALDGYFSEKDIDLSALLCGQLKKDFAWKPFEGALVNLDRADGFHAIKISAAERYCIRRGEPVLERFSFLPQKGFIGYILKSIEARLRINTGYKRKILPNEAMLLNDFKNREKLLNALKCSDFSHTIENAVDEYCRKNGLFAVKSSKSRPEDYVSYSRQNIEIDVSKLAEIRERSEETAKKLIVEETDADFVEKSASRISDEEFSERISEYSRLSEEIDEQAAEEPPAEKPAREKTPTLPEKLPEDLPDEWRGFAESLSEDEREILAVLASGKAADALCREKGTLPETVFEAINNKAMDAILDILIENGEIIPDYLDEVKKLARK